MVRSVRGGKELAAELAKRFPTEYQAWGRPQPGYFDSARRHAYFRFLMQRKYQALPDPVLVEQFRHHRRSELWFLVFLLAGFGLFGLVFVWLYFF